MQKGQEIYMYFESESVILINVRTETQQVTSPRLSVLQLFYYELCLYFERTDSGAKHRKEREKFSFLVSDEIFLTTAPGLFIDYLFAHCFFLSTFYFSYCCYF